METQNEEKVAKNPPDKYGFYAHTCTNCKHKSEKFGNTRCSTCFNNAQKGDNYPEWEKP